MDPGRLIVFTLAYLGILIVPGPGVTALVARVLARGARGVGPFIAGFVIGSLIWLTAATVGLAAVLKHAPMALLAIRYSGALYLIYLAWRLWRAPTSPLAAEEPVEQKGALKLVTAGLYINLGNPKAIIFFAAILPTVIDVNQLSPLSFLALALIVGFTATAILTAYAILALRARDALSSPTNRLQLNRISAGVVAVVAITMLLR